MTVDLEAGSSATCCSHLSAVMLIAMAIVAVGLTVCCHLVTGECRLHVADVVLLVLQCRHAVTIPEYL